MKPSLQQYYSTLTDQRLSTDQQIYKGAFSQDHLQF
jgi:hypothetical protein